MDQSSFFGELELDKLDPCFRAIFDREQIRLREQQARQELLQRLADAMAEILDRSPLRAEPVVRYSGRK